MRYRVSILIAGICLFCCCNNIPKETKNVSGDSIAQQKTSASKLTNIGNFNDRLKISGDFDGDGIIDTVYESYISELTGRETSKVLDSTDWERNIELIIKNKPVCRLYSNINFTGTYIVTKEYQQRGIFLFENLGDLNNDKGEELGYIIDWADDSNLNTYHVLTLSKNKKWKELFNFPVNETVNFESENLFKNNSVILKDKEGNIRYKFYSDSATVEEGMTIFK
jgi:hypothetical protein